MTLATSCPSCGTVFKVIEDQLKVSEGWVRCGHCHSVFNALEGLFDLGARPRSGQSRPMSTEGLASGAGGLQEQPMAERHVPAADAAAGASSSVSEVRGPTRSAVATSGLAEPSGFGRDDVDDPLLADRSGPPPSPDPQADIPTELAPPPVDVPQHDPAPEDSVHERHELATQRYSSQQLDFSDADTVFLAHDPSGAFDSVLPDERAGADRPAASQQGGRADGERFDDETPGALGSLDHGFDAASLNGPAGHDPWSAPLSEADGQTAPSFVRHADRAAWWGRPVVRAALFAGCLLAGAGLALQVGLMRRDLLAAQSPVAASVLGTACEWLGCQLEPPRLLDALTVENSAMVKLSGVEGYRLQVLLHNRADHVVRAPAVELSLTDAAGALVIRRVLLPADFRQPDALAAQAEGNWQLEFASTDRRVAGYTVAIFYP
ncbi:zinc-ribbon and DUF3426 domain-containing protein [Leptothrix sp. BB-4]